MSNYLPPQFLAPRFYRSSCTLNTSTGNHPRRMRSRARPFHSTRRTSAQQANFYEVLEITPNASQADIKKQYYKLSKANHPDLNPKNQEAASKKFVAISDAYHVLGDPDKRQKYDREHAPASSQRRGSYSSASSSASSSAGGRPASGLSKRRTTFRGPPPSFYRSGAYGEQARKRESAGGTNGRRSQAEFNEYHRRKQEGSSSTQNSSGEQSPWPFSTDPNDVPHFDRDRHYKTTTSVEEQLRSGRRKRRSAFAQQQQESAFESDAGDSAKSFLVVTGILALGIGGSMVLFSFPSATG